jgi:exo-1,4-beta-D-glucosaminidase
MNTARRRLVQLTCVAAATALVVLAPRAQGSPAAAAPVPAAAVQALVPAAPAAAGAETGASDLTDLGGRGWQVRSSAVATQSGALISAPGFDASGWLPVSNDDAGAPGTEVEALAQNGRCPGDTALQPVNQDPDGPGSIYFSDNLKRCYGSMNQVGADTVAEFDVPWWWRTDFAPRLRPGQTATLIVNGVIGSANVWVNGHEVGSSATVTGAYTRFRFSVGSLAGPGTNSLAIEVNPNNPGTMFTLDDVDWNQVPPDNNTGIGSPVQLEVDQALTDGNARVTQDNAPDLSTSALTVKSDVTNNTGSAQAGTVAAAVTPPGGGAPVTVSQSVTVPANSTRTVSFTPSAFPGLAIARPRVWWPYQLGAQPLYTLATAVSQDGAVLDSTSETFGIRTVTSYLAGKSAAEPDGARAFKVNGVPVVIRGGGFSPNLLLRYSSADTARQVALMKNMGLNTIRLEGHLMPADFYRQMDQAGILINAGFQFLAVEARVYSVTGRLLDDQTASGITLASQQVKTRVLTPVVPKAGASPAQAYFVELLLSQNGAAADRNVYWLSTQPDATNWSQTLDNPAGVITTYANLTALRTLPAPSISATATTREAGPGGTSLATTVTVRNTSSSSVAFLLRADVRRGTASGEELPGDNELQSSTWQDNDITLFPGESQALTVTYDPADLEGATPVISVSGWNAARIDIAAPRPGGGRGPAR